MSQRARRFVILTVFGVSACTSGSLVAPLPTADDASGTSPGAGSTHGTVGPPCVAYARALCERRERCEHRVDFSSMARCEERATLACEAWRKLPDLVADDRAVADCATRLAALDCHAPLRDWDPVFPFCTIGPGRRAANVPALSAKQCASGALMFRAAALCGTCSTVPFVRAETSCDIEHPCSGDASCRESRCEVLQTDASPLCPSGVACASCDSEAGFHTVYTPTGDKRCALVPASSTRCAGGASGPVTAVCAGGLACVNRNDMGDGDCRPPAADGEPCGPYGSGPACEWPATCSPTEKLCRLPSEDACARGEEPVVR